ncbi:eIF-2-alpha kinase GCN2-like [Homalodisca vitripennis]|uniref:eIF-2-alpha kinase GCN2-like n=1 Tax=Homalodisca vitripennis TaxID=197043 RepID=UPI001EEB357F|nr:eIF-2-alpha kinase GCN2-like [Homalodisca vitripennis]
MTIAGSLSCQVRVRQQLMETREIRRGSPVSTPESRSESVTSATQQFMYIQMEFCEKSTLRTAIDNGLYLEEKRVWRLLREIVEGLSHIHQQGIIHRDLKPVNIFIDSEDHVKIGDFGLATTNILHKAGAGVVVEQTELLASHNQMLSMGEVSHTGQVGTALYVAPELNTCCLKATYNQKVDIYSLGSDVFRDVLQAAAHSHGTYESVGRPQV